MAQRPPSEAIAAWSRRKLRVPGGHRREGERMNLMQWQIAFLRSALDGSNTESLLTCARRNGKSSLVAVMMLWHMLKKYKFRGTVLSVNKETAFEVLTLMADLCEEAEIPYKTTTRAGRAICYVGDGTCEALANTKRSGHGIGADIAVVDEIGLFEERHRAALQGIRSSVSTREGKVLYLGTQADGALLTELMQNSMILKHEYISTRDCDLMSETEWRRSNPGLGKVKSVLTMTNMAKSATQNPAEEPYFRAYDLNQQLQPDRQVVVKIQDWQACLVEREEDLPEKRGRVSVGLDLGGNVSSTAAVACWPETGRVEAIAAIPTNPSLMDRGRQARLGSFFLNCFRSGELVQLGDRLSDIPQFLSLIVSMWGQSPGTLSTDRYRKNELLNAIRKHGIPWDCCFRGTGSSARADGSEDVIAFQNWVIGKKIRLMPSKLIELGIATTALRHDVGGNPAVNRTDKPWRPSDPLMAAIFCIGGADRLSQREPSDFVFAEL